MALGGGVWIVRRQQQVQKVTESAWRLTVRVVLLGDSYKSKASEALGAWRHLYSTRQSRSEIRLAALKQRQAITQRQTACCFDVRGLQGFGDSLKVDLLDVPWVVAQNVSLELWLGIGVKHVTFLELWLGMTSLEIWLGMADGHEELLSCGSGWRVLPVWVCELWLVRMGPDRLLSSVFGWWVW